MFLFLFTLLILEQWFFFPVSFVPSISLEVKSSIYVYKNKAILVLFI